MASAAATTVAAMKATKLWVPIAVAMLLFAACGGDTETADDEGTDTTPPVQLEGLPEDLVEDPGTLPAPEDCANATDATATVEISNTSADEATDTPATGEVTIEITEVAELPASFEDPFISGETLTAQGRFIGYREEVTSAASAEFQPSAFFDDWRLTDGERSWPTADYTGPHQTSVSGSWAETRGDEQPATMIASGFSQTTWAVFDVPVDAEPTGIAFALDDGQECLASEL